MKTQWSCKKLARIVWQQFIARQTIHSRCTKTGKMHETRGGNSSPARQFLEKIPETRNLSKDKE